MCALIPDKPQKFKFPNSAKDASGEPTINYTSRFNVIAYIDSKHYKIALTRSN